VTRSSWPAVGGPWQHPVLTTVPEAEPHYRYSTLTAALRDPGSPLSTHFRTRFGHRRYAQDIYRDNGGPLLVPPGTAPGETLGTAFDLTVGWSLVPGHVPSAPLAETRDT
jgi:hypothetical protein